MRPRDKSGNSPASATRPVPKAVSAPGRFVVLHRVEGIWVDSRIYRPGCSKILRIIRVGFWRCSANFDPGAISVKTGNLANPGSDRNPHPAAGQPGAILRSNAGFSQPVFARGSTAAHRRGHALPGHCAGKGASKRGVEKFEENVRECENENDGRAVEVEVERVRASQIRTRRGRNRKRNFWKNYEIGARGIDGRLFHAYDWRGELTAVNCGRTRRARSTRRHKPPAPISTGWFKCGRATRIIWNEPAARTKSGNRERKTRAPLPPTRDRLTRRGHRRRSEKGRKTAIAEAQGHYGRPKTRPGGPYQRAATGRIDQGCPGDHRRTRPISPPRAEMLQRPEASIY